MGLRTKFNLIMILVFILGIGGAGTLTYKVLQDNARTEILHTAGLLMESAMAVRTYTVKEIRPLLAVQIKRNFIPQTVPAYAATRNIKNLINKYPEYTYKEATLNPTNPSSRATDWETTIVEHFRNHRNEKELVGERISVTGPMLYLARPIEIKHESCLMCHGKVNEAPETMLASYGKANGFGWKLNEIVGSQIVSVPMSVPLARAEKTFEIFMVTLVIVFLCVFIIMNLFVHFIIIKPVKNISIFAHEVSMGKMDMPECDASGKDEIASLSASFNRMKCSLENALSMLNE